MIEVTFLTFTGPCIVIYFYNTSKSQKCTISQIYIGKEFYMFRTGLMPIVKSLVLYTQQ